MSLSTETLICGHVEPGFEDVRQEFERNFSRRGEIGAAVAVYYRGKPVVDLWGGYRDARKRAPWQEDTMVIVFSTTKGLAAMAVAIANSRGWLDYDETIIRYWPEFGQQGKEGITVRQLLAHQAGLCAIDEPLNPHNLLDLDWLAGVLARQKPAWEPGTRQGYHAYSLGFYESELLRRVDPQHRSIGVFFRDEIAIPLGLDFYIGLPVEISNERLAVPTFSFPISALRQTSPRTALGLLNPSSLARRALSNPRVDASLAKDSIYRRGLELPSVNGIGSAKAIARAYSAFATGGAELGITPQTMAALTDPTVTPDKGQDLVLHISWTLSLGFARPSVGLPFGTGPRSFGAPGLGGSFGFADPDRQIGYAYTPNKMIMAQGRDPREIALRSALSRCLARM